MNYLSWLYWFNSRPEPLTKQGLNTILLITFILFVIGLAGYIGTLSRLKLPNRIVNKLITFCFTNAFIALLIAFLNYELIPYLRARVTYIIWGIIVLVWIYKIFPLKRKRVINNNSSRENEIKKYLPS